jgi:hypothetical protein
MGVESYFPILVLHFLMLAKIGPVAEMWCVELTDGQVG